MENIAQGERQAPGTETSGAKCVVCSLPLPLRPPKPGERVDRWACVSCGTRHRGVIIADCGELRGNVKPVEQEHQAAAEASVSEGIPLRDKAAAFSPRGTAQTALAPRKNVACTIANSSSDELDRSIEADASMTVPTGGNNGFVGRELRGEVPYEEAHLASGLRFFNEATDAARDIHSALHLGVDFDCQRLESVAADALSRATEDFDLFTNLGLNPPGNDYPSMQSAHVAMLSLAIGAEMGIARETLLDLAIGCMVHDAAMKPLESAFARQETLGAEFSAITRHSVDVLEMLDRVPQVSPAARLVAYQMHERCDGSGYPRGRRAAQIHALAKIAAVADTFIAITSPRPHRKALMPYYAMKHVLFGVKDGQFDGTVVRALLRIVSLFPLGSFIELSDARIGSVLRANGDQYDRPVVEVWSPSHRDGQPEVVDLSVAEELRIVRPLAGLQP